MQAVHDLLELAHLTGIPSDQDDRRRAAQNWRGVSDTSRQLFAEIGSRGELVGSTTGACPLGAHYTRVFKNRGGEITR